MADIVITPIILQDRDRWAELWRGYLDFYQTRLPPEIYEHTWQRLTAADGPIHGLGARLGSTAAPLVGIVHYLFHAHAWTTQEVCYLQDLFVDSAMRRSGCGRRLIEAVAAAARKRGCHRLYWTTKEDNLTARSLYDRIARFNGFSATTTRCNNRPAATFRRAGALFPLLRSPILRLPAVCAALLSGMIP